MLKLEVDAQRRLLRVDGRPYQARPLESAPRGQRALIRDTGLLLDAMLPGAARETLLSWTRRHPHDLVVVEDPGWKLPWERLRDPVGGALLPVARWVSWPGEWAGGEGDLREIRTLGSTRHLGTLLDALPEGLRARFRSDAPDPGEPAAEGGLAVLHACCWSLDEAEPWLERCDLVVYDPWPKQGFVDDILRRGRILAQRLSRPVLAAALEDGPRATFFEEFYDALAQGETLVDAWISARDRLEETQERGRILLNVGPGVPPRRPMTRRRAPPPEDEPLRLPPRRPATPRAAPIQLTLMDAATGKPLPEGPLTLGRPIRLEARLNLGEAAAGAATADVPPRVDISLQSASFSLESLLSSHADAPEDRGTGGVWSTRAFRGLRVLPSGQTAPISAEIVPLEEGQATLRVLVYCRNLLLHALRLDAAVQARPSSAPVAIGLLEALPPQALPLLERAGIRTCAEFAAMDLGALAELLRMPPDVALDLQRQARVLSGGRGSLLEYSAELGPGELSRIVPRSASIYASLVGRTHVICVRTADGKLERAVRIRPDRVPQLLDATRRTLEKAGARVTDYPYAHEAQGGLQPNEGSPDQLRVSLIALAQQGYHLYREIFYQPDRQFLRDALREPGTIGVARLSAGDSLPWALFYDLDLSEERKEPPGTVCNILFRSEKSLDSHEHYTVGATPPAEQPVCSARPECPLRDPRKRDRVVCPWGFWGFKHRIELPPLRVDDDVPRPMLSEVDAEPRRPLRALICAHPRLSRTARHRAELNAIFAGHHLAYAWRTLDEVRQALGDRGLQILYFFGHAGYGEQGEEFGGLRAELRVSGDERRLTPYLLEGLDESGRPSFDFPRHPLVFINGCESADMHPRAPRPLVEAFARLGASGVIGTEGPVWQPLATEVGERFWRGLLGGEAVGPLLRNIRLELLRKNNPLGLLYTAYAPADLRLAARSR